MCVAAKMWSRFVMSQVKHNSFFLVGMAAGLWVSLAVIPLEEPGAVCPAGLAAGPELGPAAPDEYEPRREEKPLGSGGQTAGRALQRPRYYSTELGMRGSLLTGVLSSEEALGSGQAAAALNRSLAALQPALKFFITATTMTTVPGHANVVGFTDTREMLKPFHALKYLADNYLEEYDFFYLVEDTGYVNARRLRELAAGLSVSQHLYMGEPAGGDYCALASGVLLSNSVLRAVHAELEWCVRNSYSPHHHENLGRCVLHAARTPCTPRAQGAAYRALRLAPGALPAGEEAARAVWAGPAAPRALAALHAGAARAELRAGAARAGRLRRYLRRNLARHPPGYRNHTWPAGLRRDPGLAPPLPDSRFAHLRWTLFNATHAYMPDEVRAVGALAGAARAGVRAAVRAAEAWAARRWGARARLLEGAWRWEPAAALRYRLLLRLQGAAGGATRAVELCLPVGPARLVPLPYVTESPRVWAVLAVPRGGEREGADFLLRYEKVALQQDKNTNLFVVYMGASDNTTAAGTLRAAVAALAARHNGSLVELLAPGDAGDPGDSGPHQLAAAGRGALRAAERRAPGDALLLLVPPHLDFNQDFLNRVRMNTIPGVQWFLPVPFARHAQYAHPRFVSGAGGKPATNTGRFAPRPRAPLLAAYCADVRAARRAWRPAEGAEPEPAELLARAPLHALRAPEPGAVLAPRAPPCAVPPAEPLAPPAEPLAPPAERECRRALERERFERLDLGARTALAQLLLEVQSEAD